MNGKLLKALVIPASASTCLLPTVAMTSCSQVFIPQVHFTINPEIKKRSYCYWFPDWAEDGKTDPDSESEINLCHVAIDHQFIGPDHLRLSTRHPIDGLTMKFDERSGCQVYLNVEHFNAYMPHPEYTLYIEANAEGISDGKNYPKGWFECKETVTIPAYDGSVAIKSGQQTDGSIREDDLDYPWGIWEPSSIAKEKFHLDNYDKICLGIWRVDKHPAGTRIAWSNGYAKSRIITLSSYEYLIPQRPDNGYKVEAINDNAFNLEVDNDMDLNDPDWGRTAACETFRNYFFGSQEHPDWGFWKEIRFEGYVTPLEKIGDHAFYHCWSLEASLATYYGAQEAHNMVYNGTHS